MRRYLYGGISAVAVGGVAVAIALFAGPTGKWAVPEGVRSAEADLLESCDPGNQSAEGEGPAFKSLGSGTGRFWESEVDGTSISGDYVGGKIVWSFLQVATQDVGPGSYTGNVYGFLVAKVSWDNGEVAHFVSRCLAEVKTFGGTVRRAEVTAEGDVTGFPTDTSTQSATAVLKMRRDTNTRKVAVKFILYIGSHCGGGSREFTVGANSIDEQGESPAADGLGGRRESGVAAGVLKSPDSTAGVNTGGCTEDEGEEV